MVDNNAELIGYELHIVEQWACSRRFPTPFVLTFTGLHDHRISVGVLEAPKDEQAWPPRLKMYMKAVSSHHARTKETALGIVMVTNLSGFPSILTVINVSKKSMRHCRERFAVNENLKRLGCSGRAGLNLGPHSIAAEAKFSQLYHTSDRIPLETAVVELVKLCQVALVMFTKLAPEYVDGLLCDLTEHALNDWWTEVGMEYFTVEPNDGVLGPTTVASLLGLFLGARNRLNASGAPVSKDAFDSKAMKRGVAYFQKTQKLPRTRRLDHKTLDLLHRTTSKAASSEGWAVPRAVKSTMAELSGKGGEMVMGMVGTREKAGIAEVETLDISKFVDSVSGESCKWLWHGRPRKAQTLDLARSPADENAITSNIKDREGRNRIDGRREVSSGHGKSEQAHPTRLYSQPPSGSQTSVDTSDREQSLPKTVFRSVTGRMIDARSGLGRITGAVSIPSRRGYLQRQSKEIEPWFTPEHRNESDHEHNTHPSTGVLHESLDVKDAQGDDNYLLPIRSSKSFRLFSEALEQLPSERAQSSTAGITEIEPKHDKAHPSRSRYCMNTVTRCDKESEAQVFKVRSAAKQNLLNVKSLASLRRFKLRDDENCPFASDLGWLARNNSIDGTQSSSAFWTLEKRSRAPDIERITRDEISEESYRSFDLSAKLTRISQIEQEDMQKLYADTIHVDSLDHRARSDLCELHVLFEEKLQNSIKLPTITTDLVSGYRQSAADACKDAEILGAKLEYELDSLVSKVEDVEDGISDFERQVSELEGRTLQLGTGGLTKIF